MDRAAFRQASVADAPGAIAAAMERARLGPEVGWLGPAELAAREPRVGIIGSRNAGAASLEAIEALASQLAARHAVIVSGAARGTDMAGHRAALARGGPTIACAPMGLGTVDLESWRPEFAAAAPQSLLLIGPFPADTDATRQTPILRNRLIAALSEVVVAGEAGIQSGTNACLANAAELGVPLFLLESADPEVRRAQAFLEQRGATVFAPAECLGDKLPAAIIDAARRHRLALRRAERAQLRLL